MDPVLMGRQVRGRPKLGGGSPRRWTARGADAQPVLGVDIGGVIVDRVAEGSDTSFFGARPMDTPAVSGALEAVAALNAEVFGGRVFIVSKAGPRTAETTRRWLAHIDFHRRTAIPAEHVHFVRERIDKAPVCERLGVTHFVDDRVDVLGHLSSVAFRYLFTGGLGGRPAPRSVPNWAIITDDWADLRRRITRSMT